LLVGAIVAVNPFGDVLDPETGRILAGARSARIGSLKIGGREEFADTLKVMKTLTGRAILNLAGHANTVIAVVATNARFDKAQTTKIAQMAHDGLARVIRPAHTMFDGDTIFSLATGQMKADVSIVGAYTAEVLALAIVSAVRNAKPAAGLPALGS
jgi:L-aminopeptidase/D-esterase-like protein